MGSLTPSQPNIAQTGMPHLDGIPVLCRFTNGFHFSLISLSSLKRGAADAGQQKAASPEGDGAQRSLAIQPSSRKIRSSRSSRGAGRLGGREMGVLRSFIWNCLLKRKTLPPGGRRLDGEKGLTYQYMAGGGKYVPVSVHPVRKKLGEDKAEFFLDIPGRVW